MNLGGNDVHLYCMFDNENVEIFDFFDVYVNTAYDSNKIKKHLCDKAEWQ